MNNQDILIKFKNSVSYNKINSILVGDYGALQIFKDKKCILDSTFNLYNSYALNYFNNHDAILSLEMSRKQVNHLNNIKQNIIMTVYGKTINMHLKHCLISCLLYTSSVIVDNSQLITVTLNDQTSFEFKATDYNNANLEQKPSVANKLTANQVIDDVYINSPISTSDYDVARCV